jgi:hypothetical protein
MSFCLARLSRKPAADFVLGEAGDGYKLVAAGLAPENGDGGLFGSEHVAEEIDKLFVGFAAGRRRGYFDMQDIVPEPGDFISAGVGCDFYPEMDNKVG